MPAFSHTQPMPRQTLQLGSTIERALPDDAGTH